MAARERDHATPPQGLMKNSPVANIIVAGAGGHAGIVIDTIRALGQFTIVGLIDQQPMAKTAYGLPIVGNDDLLPQLLAQGIAKAANGVGSVKDNGPRRRIFERLKSTGFTLPALIHPRAWVSESAELGDGVQVMAGALIQSRTNLNANVLVNTGAIVEHDCHVDAHVHISSGARVGGGVTIGECAFVGLGSSIRQGVRIGARALIAAGSVVVRNVPDDAVVISANASTEAP